MDRYKKLFKRLKNKKEGIFVPFIVLGDPNKQISINIINNLIEAGADALELGIPFSDPLADGPTIQKASLRSLNSGTTIDSCFEIVSFIRNNHSDIPIGILVYANLVFNKGIDNFYSQCYRNNVDSILIPDVPVEESKFFLKFSNYYKISQIFICPPNADDNLIYKISNYGGAYIYLSSRSGITGVEQSASLPLVHLIKKLKKYKSPPILQGFGISKPQEINMALKLGLSGSIVGSAIIKIIERNVNNTVKMLHEIKLFAQNMKSATFY